MGYGPFRVELGEPGVGQSARLVDVPSGDALIEVVLEKRRLGDADMLYVHWLALRNPRASFSEDRPQLPGQDVPGLGLAREMTEILARMAVRLDLAGLAFRPSSYPLPFRVRRLLRFGDPAPQRRSGALAGPPPHPPLSQTPPPRDA